MIVDPAVPHTRVLVYSVGSGGCRHTVGRCGCCIPSRRGDGLPSRRRHDMHVPGVERTIADAGGHGGPGRVVEGRGPVSRRIPPTIPVRHDVGERIEW